MVFALVQRERPSGPDKEAGFDQQKDGVGLASPSWGGVLLEKSWAEDDRAGY